MKKLLHMKGYNYCGLNNQKGARPVNSLDNGCFQHDVSAEYADLDSKPYINFNAADGRLLDDIKDIGGLEAGFVRTVFKGKRKVSAFIQKYVKKPRRRSSSASGRLVAFGKSGYKRTLSRAGIANIRRRKGFRGRRTRSFSKMRYTRRKFQRRRRVNRRYVNKRKTYRSRVRRHRRGGSRRISAAQIANAIAPRRQFFYENSGVYGISTSDTVCWCAPVGINDRNIMVVMQAETAAGGTPFIGAAEQTPYGHYWLKTYNCLSIRNQNLHPMKIDVFWCLFRTDAYGDGTITNPQQFAMQTLYDDWATYMWSTDVSTTLQYSPGDTTVYSTVQQFGLMTGNVFKKNFKVSKGKHGVLNPGGSFDIRYKSKYFKRIEQQWIDQTNAVSGTIFAFAKYTVVPIIRWQMADLHDSTVGISSHAVPGTGYLHFYQKDKYNVKYIANTTDEIALGVSKYTNYTTEGPTFWNDEKAE